MSNIYISLSLLAGVMDIFPHGAGLAWISLELTTMALVLIKAKADGAGEW